MPRRSYASLALFALEPSACFLFLIALRIMDPPTPTAPEVIKVCVVGVGPPSVDAEVVGAASSPPPLSESFPSPKAPVPGRPACVPRFTVSWWTVASQNADSHWAYLHDLLYIEDREEAARRRELVVANAKGKANLLEINGDKPGQEAPSEVSDSPGEPNVEVVQGLGGSPTFAGANRRTVGTAPAAEAAAGGDTQGWRCSISSECCQ